MKLKYRFFLIFSALAVVPLFLFSYIAYNHYINLSNSQITDTYTTLENLDLFMNAVTANFDKTKNIAIKAKSLEVSNNTMQHAGIISILTIFGIPLVILIYGFMRWWKRRKV